MKQIFFLTLFILSYQKISILSPESLKSQFGDIPASYSNYGKMSTSYIMNGMLVLPLEHKNDSDYACSPLHMIKPINVNLYNNYVPVVLVDRGNCSFVQMTRNIQKAGGYFAIIINSDSGNVDSIQLSDDGTGSDIVIPTALIPKEEGKQIQKFMIDNPNEAIYLNLDFYIDKFDEVSLTMYMNVADEESYALLKDFNEYYMILKNTIKFNPIYVTFQIDNLTDEEKQKHCVSNGKYCLNVNLPNNYNVTGRDLILDSLFHHCMYQLSSKYHHPDFFVLFASQYYEHCLYSKNYTRYCASEYLPLYGIAKDEIMDCVYESFGTDRKEVEVISKDEQYLDNENTVLYSNYQKFISSESKTIPSVYVNIDRMNGQLNAKVLFQNICDGFSKRPSYCDDYDFIQVEKVNKGLTGVQIFLIVIGVIFINLIIFLCCRRYMQKKIRDKVETDDFDLDGKINTVVNSYLTLKDIKDVQAKGKL